MPAYVNAKYPANGRPPAVQVGAPPAGKVPEVGPGRVVFVTNVLTVQCKLGATSATPGGGVGGWNDVSRPGRAATVEWGSTPARTLSVPVLLDGLVERRSIESEVAAFYTIGQPPPGSPRGTDPPIIRVGGMVPHSGLEWVLTDFVQGEATWDGVNRIRLWATVELKRFLPLDVVKVIKKSTAAASTRTYTVKRGDTLGSIARDQMGAKTASAIAKGVATLKTLNKMRDPKAIKAGDKLKIPK